MALRSAIMLLWVWWTSNTFIRNNLYRFASFSFIVAKDRRNRVYKFMWNTYAVNAFHLKKLWKLSNNAADISYQVTISILLIFNINSLFERTRVGVNLLHHTFWNEFTLLCSKYKHRKCSKLTLFFKWGLNMFFFI